MLPLLDKLLEPRSNPVEAAGLLTDALRVKITKTALAREIEEHPDYPALLSISDVLRHYGIDNLAIKLAPERLDQAPTPFITPVRGQKSPTAYFTVVREVTEDGVSFFDPEKHKWVSTPLNGFLHRFSGTVLLAEAGENAGEKEYDKNSRAESRKRGLRQFSALCIPGLVLGAAIFAFIQDGAAALLPFIFAVLTLAGLLTSVLLVWYELDQYNPVLQQICSAGKKVNCGAVLQSAASRIMGISWSAIGFTYFAGQLLLLLSSGMTDPLVLFAVSWLNVLALPYVFFSVYYQWQIARQWCVLCLCVQGLLVLQFVTALSGGWQTALSLSQVRPWLVFAVMAVLAVPFIGVTLLIPALQKAKESRNNKNELQRLKHNPRIFEALLSRQKEVVEPAEGLGITLGNPDARYKIIKVCNPYCGPCAAAHAPMEDLLENNPDVRVQIIFTTTNEEGDFRMPPVRHLLAIAETGGETRIKQALDDWYGAPRKDYAAFAAKYPIDGEGQTPNTRIQAMRDWCERTDIAFTPTFFVNGRQLPGIYSVSDLKYFLTV